ncbi:hypothetical protein ACEQ8H_005826 [Pleosporales sp. CAS-2024a]
MVSGQPFPSRFWSCYSFLAAWIVILFVSLWIFHDTAFQLVSHAPEITIPPPAATTPVPSLDDLAAPPVIVTEPQVVSEAPSSPSPSPSPSPVPPAVQPTDEDKGIPRKLWYKMGPHGVSEEIRGWTKTCIDLNPGYEVDWMTEESGDNMVKRVFASRPELVQDFLAIQVPIVKADILRYVMLYDQGGVWSDLDVSCEGIPIDKWIPEEYKNKVDLVVGWEFDYGWEGNYVRQFTSWTIMARKGSPHLLQTIDDTFEALHQKANENHVSVGNVTMKMMGDVVDFSGPRRLTFAIYKSLSKQLKREVVEGDMSKLLQPKLVGDVLALPGRSFAASTNRYTPEEEAKMPPKLVIHHYAGSWKNEHGGEQ